MPLTKERMRGGELYRGDDPELNAELDARQALVQELNAIPYGQTAQRARRLGELLGHIGERTFVNFDCAMLDGAPIEIGRECMLASSVQLITATHPADPRQRREAWDWRRRSRSATASGSVPAPSSARVSRSARTA